MRAAVKKTPSRSAGKRAPALRSFRFDVVTLDADGREAGCHRGDARQFAERLGGGVPLHMVHIPGGAFTMGAPESEPGSRGSERPQHQVTVPPFYLGRYPVTIDQWRAVMGARPHAMKIADDSFKRSARQPVVRISFDEAADFCARLSRRSRRAYRLPTEAEWEYACRAGTSTAFAFGLGLSRAVAVHDGETVRRASPDKRHPTTRPVGSLRVANGFGLSDMHGNVWEWCEDWWHGSYQGAPEGGRAWTSDGDSRTRVLRGGSWYATAEFCRSASRSFGGEFGIRSRQIGFRLAMTA